MKILIIQLARLGDIYLTYPSIIGLIKKYPEAEISILVKDKFKEATLGLPANVNVLCVDTKTILSPMILNEGKIQVGIDESMKELEALMGDLRAQGYTHIYNLTFSPFSSYLTKYISQDETVVKGYTRFQDGYLAIPDEVSSYFYSQVGINKFNRVHLSEIFASMLDVILEGNEWQYNPEALESSGDCLAKFNLDSGKYIAIHVGASQEEKAFGAFKWQQVLVHLLKQYDGDIILIGSSAETSIVDEIFYGVDLRRVKSLVGATSVPELVSIIAGAQVVVGGDSVPMHIAKFTETPCLNISFSCVNFWETGPLANNSRIIYAETKEEVASDRVAAETLALLNGEKTGYPVINCEKDGVLYYKPEGYQFESFSWHFIQALYMSEDFPVVNDHLVASSIQRLSEISQLAIEQFDRVKDKSTSSQAMDILDQVDVLILGVEKMVPEIQPLIAWFQAERIRIGPDDLDTILLKTKLIFEKLNTICSLYVTTGTTRDKLGEGNANASMVK